ncbi:MAG: DUF1289 domain-containing protein [Sphingorhabdus sp.]
MNSNPASPCNQVCDIDAVSGYCNGCRRSLDEIAIWGSASPVQKQAILDALEERSAQFDQAAIEVRGS